MEETLRALAAILLKAVPTFLLVIVLHFYLKYTFFRPLERVLHARYEATQGARKMAEESMQKAAAKTAEYEAAMRAARGEVYQGQERFHHKLQEERAAEIREARARAEQLIAQAKADLAGDVEQARQTLAGESELLAGRIAESILRGSVAS